MNMPIPSHPLILTAKAAAAALALSMALGCSLYKAQKACDEGRYEDAVQAFQTLLKQDPANVKAKIGYRRAATLAAEQHLEKARTAEKRGQEEVVFEEVRRALVLDPNNAVAADWLANLETEAQRRKLREERELSLTAQKDEAEANNILQLNPRIPEGMDLTYETKTNLREIFKHLSKATGINILFHTSFPEGSASINLKGMTFQKILDTLMLQNELFYKVLDRNTIMLFKATPQNRELYENTLLKTFYLSNAEPDAVRNVIGTVNQQIKVFTDKRLNAITIKAKPNELAIAQRIVKQLDKAKAEVAVYLELLEVTENSLEQVGLLPVLQATDGIKGGSGVYRVGATVDNTGGINQNKGGIRITKSDLRFLFPNLALDALKSSGDAKLVASPNVRVVSGEKGEINIGEKISTTQSSFGMPSYGGSGGTPSTPGGANVGGLGLAGLNQSYSYEDVGVKITVEPRVHHDGDITLTITAEIKTLKSGSEAGRPDLGQRIIKTSARLKDGETAVFAGLLKEEEQKSLQGIWGLTDIPILGKLLGSNRKTRAKTDVILTIRSVLVRKPDLTREDFEAFDPDMARAAEGPFSPKKTPEPAKPEESPQEPTPEAAEDRRPTPMGGPKRPLAPRAPKEAGAGAKPATAPGRTPGTEAPEPAAKAEGTPTEPAPKAANRPAERPAEAPAAAAADVGELVLFITPLNTQIAKGERVRLAVMVSGGKGVDGGTLEMRVDPKLKLLGTTAGDFILNEGGAFDTPPAKDGIQVLTFKRNGAATDSGTLAFMELEGLAPGQAPVLIQSGRFLSGKNPLSGRWVNALVIVE